MKRVGTKGLQILKSECESYNFGRSISADTLAKVDPDGIHIISILVAKNPSDLAVIPHHRCEIFLKMAGSDRPQVQEIDIATNSYEILREAETYAQ